MGYRGMHVVDADAHYLEEIRDFAKYLKGPAAERFADWSGQYHMPALVGDQYDVMLHGRTVRGAEAGKGDQDEMLGMSSPADIPLVMERFGIDTIVMIPTYMLMVEFVRNPNHAMDICNGYIDYMLDGVCAPEAGVYTLLVASGRDPERAAKMIDRVAGEPAVCGVEMLGSVELPLGSEAFNPIYEAAQHHGLPIVLHANFLGPDLSSFAKFPSFVESHALDMTWCNQVQLVSMVMEGVPERFPDLKIVFQESGITWVAGLMYRLDTEYMRRRVEAPLLRKLPSEYIKDFYFGTQPMEEMPRKQLRMFFEMLDAENTFLFASDWPHFDYDEPSAIADLPFLSDAGRRKIMGENALGVFRFTEQTVNLEVSA